MALHIEFAFDDAQDSAIGSDHESCAFAGKRSEALDSEECGNFAFGIRQKQKAKIVLYVECFLPTRRVGADPHALGSEFREHVRQVAKVTAFDRSARRHRFRIKEQHQRSALQHLTQPHGVPILVHR